MATCLFEDISQRADSFSRRPVTQRRESYTLTYVNDSYTIHTRSQRKSQADQVYKPPNTADERNAPAACPPLNTIPTFMDFPTPTGASISSIGLK